MGLFLTPTRQLQIGFALSAALSLAAVTFWIPMQQGIRALEEMG